MGIFWIYNRWVLGKGYTAGNSDPVYYRWNDIIVYILKDNTIKLININFSIRWWSHSSNTPDCGKFFPKEERVFEATPGLMIF